MTKENQNIEIPNDVVWYVKTGLDRALRLTRQNIEQTDKRITHLKTKHENLMKNDPNNSDLEFITEFIKEAEGIRAYYRQWLHEATDAFKALPKEIRPDADR